MKVAICFSGQYRTFDSDVVQKSLKHYLLDRYDCDLYFSLWDNRGISVNHTHGYTHYTENDIINENSILKYVNPVAIEIENYAEWFNSISVDLQNKINSNLLHSGCIPQLYKKFKSHELIPKDAYYDFVIIARPDLFYFDNFNIDTMLQPNTIWNCNPVNTWAYYPGRIFDIMYMGTASSIQNISDCYYYINQLLDDPYNTRLNSLDCCKMLYTYAKKFKNLSVQSTDTLLCNVYRDVQSVEYNLINCNISIENFKNIIS